MTSEAKWTARVEAWKKSGLTSKEFSEGKGYAASTLQYWASRLRRGRGWHRTDSDEKAQGDRAIRIAQVVRVAPMPQSSEVETPIVIETGGVRVSVRRGFDGGALREVLSVIGGER